MFDVSQVGEGLADLHRADQALFYTRLPGDSVLTMMVKDRTDERVRETPSLQERGGDFRVSDLILIMLEQLMRQVATGRKNWMHVGSVTAGGRAANLMTIVSTAARNDLDVWAYLKDVMDQALAGGTDWESLRADRWKERHPEAVRTYREEERRDAIDRKRLRRARRRIEALKNK